MKKKIVLIASLMVLLTGCSELPQAEKQKQAEAEEFGLFIDKLVVLLKERKLEEKEKKTETSSSSQESPETSAETSAEPSQETEAPDKSQYPYMVSLSELAGVSNFTKTGMNIPNNISVAFITESSGSVTMSSNQPGSNIIIYTASYRQIPTQSIRVFSAGSNEIRTVTVNSEIVLEYLASAYGAPDQGNLYVFTNSSGGLSLATPNYAGNVTAGEADVMLEYVP